MTAIIFGIVLFIIGLVGILSHENINETKLDVSSNETFQIFLKSNSSKSNFVIQLICGLLIVIFSGINLSNEPNNISETTATPAVDIKTQTNEASASNTNTQNEAEQSKCEICGIRFTGKGYCEGDDGEWRPCEYPYSTKVCSYTCAMQEKQKAEKAWQKVDEKVSEMQSRNNEDYYSRQRERMRNQGYSEGEINEMRDPNKGDPEIKKSAKSVFDAIKERSQHQ